MKFKPLYDRILIKPESVKSTTESGLVLPQTSQERPQVGVVKAVGDGENFNNEKCELKVKVNDKIVFSKYAGIELKLNGETYVVLRQIDIIGVLDERENNC